jgi:hypothetical protein
VYIDNLTFRATFYTTSFSFEPKRRRIFFSFSKKGANKLSEWIGNQIAETEENPREK